MILNDIKVNKPNVQSAKRQDTYIEDRIYYEGVIQLFIKKGGKLVGRFLTTW